MDFVIVALVLWAWGALAVSGAPAAPPPARAAASLSYLLDGDTCLTPGAGLFTPEGFSPSDLLVRELLLGDTGDHLVLLVVVQPTFKLPYSLRLEQPRPTPGASEQPQPYRLRLVRAKKHLWSQTMDEMDRQQGNPFKLGAAEQQRALAAISKVTETKLVPVTDDLANRLAAVWAGVLARAQYVNEVTEVADGCDMMRAKLDGTSYDFWHGGRSGTAASPEKGTLLGDLVQVVETLARYADAAPRTQPALLTKLDAALAALQKRIERNEPCLRPYPHRAHR